MKISRYFLVIFAGVLAIFPLVSVSQAAFTKQKHGHYLVYVGTYGTHNKGIYAYRFDDDAEKAVSLGLVAETLNPFFLAPSINGKYLYATNMGSHFQGHASGSVSAFGINMQTGQLALLNQVAARGSDPAYITIDKTGRFALIANYTGGSVGTLPILKNGSLGEVNSFVQHTASGIGPKGGAPHPHSIKLSPDNRFALVADLGLDKIYSYPFSTKTGLVASPNVSFTSVQTGSGPRHLVFSPNGKFVYVINEMGSTVMAFSYDKTNGALQSLQTISSLPKEFTGKNTGAEIQIAASGKFLYASNRGDDTIAVFTIDAAKGTLTPIDYVPSGGKTPGNFEFDPDGSHLFIANKDSGTLTIFRVNKDTGRLTSLGQSLEVPDPVCIKFVPIR